MSTGNTGKRTALLVRCTAEEAETIRESAKAERRTMSGFILNVVFQHVEARRGDNEQFQRTLSKPSKRPRNSAVKMSRARPRRIDVRSDVAGSL